MLHSLARSALRRLASLLQVPKIIIGSDGSPYLSRWTLAERGKDAFRVYLHCFHRSDEDEELHTHPWAWAVSFILAGGYVETRRVGKRVVDREMPPGSVNVLFADTAHRVDLYAGETWTLFVAGPVVSSWGFWRWEDDTFTPWRDFIMGKGLQV